MESNELIRQYLLGMASDEQVNELEGRLRSDEQLQDEFLLQAELDAHLRQEAQSGFADGNQPVADTHVRTITPSSNNSTRVQTMNRVLFVIAVVALIAVFSQAIPFREHKHEFITITSLSGPVEWTGDGGRVTEHLAVGARLPGGTMELLGPDSWINFEFQDQSTVTLTGLSEVTITAQQDRASKQQKALHLKHGHLSASVRPQPSGYPMLVHTPSAELKVLGTQFDVETVLEATRLTVNEGRVHLKRLADGKEVDVPARQSVTASLEDGNGMSPSERKTPVTVWKSNLRADVVRGKWTSDLWMLGAQLKRAVASGEMTEAAALIAYKKSANFDDTAGSVWALPSAHGALVVLSLRPSARQPVLLTEHARVRVRGRVYSRTALRVGLSAYRHDGGFAGKYSARVETEEFTGADNEFEIDLPLSCFRDENNPAGSPVGNELVDWWCVTETSSAKVEITSVELTDTPEQDKP